MGGALCARRAAATRKTHSFHYSSRATTPRDVGWKRLVTFGAILHSEQYCSNVALVWLCDLYPLEFPGIGKFRSDCHHKPLLSAAADLSFFAMTRRTCNQQTRVLQTARTAAARWHQHIVNKAQRGVVNIMLYHCALFLVRTCGHKLHSSCGAKPSMFRDWRKRKSFCVLKKSGSGR